MLTIPVEHAYLFLVIPFLLVWLGIFVFGSHTRRLQVKASVLGALAGPISEILYFSDYWKPTGVVPIWIGSHPLLIEDMLFGFAIAGIAVSIFPAVFRVKRVRLPEQVVTFRAIILLALVFVASTLLGIVGGLNSIYATTAAFMVTAFVMLWYRPNLIRTAIWSGILVFLVVFSSYFVLLSITANTEELLKQVWLLYGTALDVRVLGIPITELAFAFSVGFFLGPFPAFARNKTAP